MNDRISERSESGTISSLESIHSKADNPIQVTNAKADGYFSAIKRFIDSKILQKKNEVKDLEPMKSIDSYDSTRRPKELNKLAFEEQKAELEGTAENEKTLSPKNVMELTNKSASFTLAVEQKSIEPLNNSNSKLSGSLNRGRMIRETMNKLQDQNKKADHHMKHSAR